MRMVMVWAALALALMASPAWSQTCSVGATGEAFGTYNPFNATATTSTSTVTITCQSTLSLLVSYTISLDGGSAGSVMARSMASGTTRLPYQLYKDILYSQVWGDGTGGSSPVTDGYLLGVLAPVVKSYVAYGSITAGHQVAPGIYGDVITILLTY